jgi:uncharacterized cofD-like protein
MTVERPPPAAAAPAVVALGGGHGLATSLRALRRCTARLTAVVTVGDDGGSSGVLRRDLGVLPPGDLRMALTALAGEQQPESLWADVARHRFDRGDLRGHPVGNLMLVALMEEMGDPVQALDRMGELLGAVGRVLPMCEEPVEIVARLTQEASTAGIEVRGQVAVAASPGQVVSIALDPADPKVCEAAVESVLAADAVVLGPGSWFSSVLPHLLVPALRSALRSTTALRVVTLNLAPQPGETGGFTPENHLEVLTTHAPDLRLDVVIVDPTTVGDRACLDEVAHALGAQVLTMPVASTQHPDRHDVDRLASAYAAALERGRIRPWR